MINIYKKDLGIQLTNHFNLDELDCKCSYESCYFTLINSKSLDSLELSRIDFEKPIIVTSGNRCARHHEDLRKRFPNDTSEKTSHSIGDAFDVKPQNAKDMGELEECLKKRFKFVKRYKRHFHVDNRLLKE
jgi:hypothetical protein